MIKTIGIVVLIVILVRVDLGVVFQQLQGCHLPDLVLAVLLIFPQIALRAFRWQDLLTRQGVHCPWPRALTFYFAAVFAGLMTPGRLGELAKGVFLKQHRIASISRSLPSVMTDRFLDLVVLLALALLAFPHFDLIPHAGKVSALALGLMVTLIALGLNWLVASQQLLAIASKIKTRLKSNWSGTLDDFVAGSRALISTGLLASLVWTLAGYAVFFMQTNAIGHAIALPADFMTIARVVSISILVGFIPITFAGLGTRDAMLIFLFGLAGVDQASALSFAILYIFVNVICLGVISFLFWFFLPKPHRRVEIP